MIERAKGLVSRALRWAKGLATGKEEFNPDGEGGPRGRMPQHPKSPDDYVAYVNERYDAWYQARYPYETSWYLDCAFYFGMQWHEWSDEYRALREPRGPSTRVRYVANFIMPTIETQVGKMTRGLPDLTASPAQAPDARAFASARVVTKLLKSNWERLFMGEVYQSWIYWGSICGHSYVKTYWDPSRGEMVNIPGQKPFPTGEMVCEPMGPYTILTPPNLRSMNLQPTEFIDARMFSIDEAEAHWPEIAGKLEVDDDERAGSFEERLASLVSPLGYRGFGEKSAQKERRVLVKELWQDPLCLTAAEREQFPTGRVTIVIGKTFVDAIPNPYGWNPLVDLKAKWIPGRYHGGSMVDQLIPIQRVRNRSRSVRIESEELCANPMVVYEKGSEVSKPIAKPGQWIEFRKGFSPPKFMDPVQMSDYHVKNHADTDEEYQQVSQQREVTRGQVPAANITGVAINLLQEADNTPLGPFAQRIARGLAGIGYRQADLGRKFYREPRLINVTGSGHETEVLEFVGTQHPIEMIVRCSVDSILPESRAARQARTLEALQAGAFDPVKHRPKIIRMLEFGDPNEIWEEQDAHAQKARRENRKLVKGIWYPVDSFDDDQVHILEHDRFRTSEEFEDLPLPIKALINAHCDMHLDKMRTVAMLGAAAGAQPGQPGQSPGQPEVQPANPEAMPGGEV